MAKRRYKSCIRPDGLCGVCYQFVDIDVRVDCKGKPISPLLWRRSEIDYTQQMLADASGINARQILRFEQGTSLISNMPLENAVKLSNAIHIPIEEMYRLDVEYRKKKKIWDKENNESEST